MKRRAVLTLAAAAALSGALVWTGRPHWVEADSPAPTAPSAEAPATRARPSATSSPTGSAAPPSSARTPRPSPRPSPSTATTDPSSAAPTQHRAPASPERTKASALWQPNRLVVPALGVDAPVVPIAATGSVLTPPDDPRVIGWWNATARVGEQGSVVLTGHTVHTGGGALDHLNTLRPGDVVRLAGSSHAQRYRVTSVRDYSKADFARNATGIFDQDVPARLVVITCDNYDRRTRDYLSNTVVLAAPM